MGLYSEGLISGVKIKLKNAWACYINGGKVNNELRVQIHELRVQIYGLRVEIYELRVQIHELEH